MINGSSPSAQMFMHGDSKMVKIIFAKVEIVAICVEYVND
jgi:hypothetical protein